MKGLLKALFGDAIARMLSGAGMSVVSFAALLPLVQGALTLTVQHINSLPGDIAAIALLGGLGEAVSIIGSCILTRMAIVSMSTAITKSAA